MRGTILIATVGQSDLQLLVEAPDGAIGRAEIKDGARAIHRALLREDLDYQIDPTLTTVEKMGILRAKWQPDATGISLERDFRPVMRNGAVVLVPAKLAQIADELANPGDRVAVLVLNTHRDEAAENDRAIREFWPREPIAAGRIVAGWLAERFGLTAGSKPGEIGFGIAGWVDYLDGRMAQSGAFRDHPLNREAVRRIDRALRQLQDEAAQIGLEPLRVHVSAGGGPPGYREVVEACARFRFGRDRVRLCHQREEATYRPERADDPPSPLDSYRSREHAMELIRNGDFSGARASVPLSISEDSAEKRWVGALERVSLYFEGRLSPRERAQQAAYLMPLIADAIPRCLLVAMRTEAALRAKRIPEAIAWTCTFFDAALLDSIERLPNVESLNDIRGCVQFLPGHLPSGELTTAPFGNEPPCLRMIGQGDQPAFQYRTDSWRKNRWIAAFPKPAGAALAAYHRALRDPAPEVGISPSGLRNVNLHSIVGQELMNEVCVVFRSKRLWAEEGETCYFLNQSLAMDVLTALEINAPAKLYETLVAGLCRKLMDYKLR